MKNTGKIKINLFKLIIIFSILFLFSPHISFADYGNVVSDSSAGIGSSYNHFVQTLGTGLSGDLSQVDIQTSNPSFIYYGSTPYLVIFECNDDTYGGLLQNERNCAVLYEGSAQSSSLFSTSTQSFLIDNVVLDPTKYYYLLSQGNNQFNTLTYYYGSSLDVLEGSCYQYVSGGNFFGYISCSGVSDLYFNLVGVSRSEAPPNSGNSSVLFLPGLMGSRLYEETGSVDCGGVLVSNECFADEEIWVSISDSKQAKLSLNAQGKSINQIYTKEEDGVIDEIFGTNIYKSFMSDLEQWKTDGVIPDYAVIPYDWRLSLEDVITNGSTTTREKLSYDNSQIFLESFILNKLQELQSESESGMVTIIAHSNGGLVTKALIQKLKDTNNPLYYQIDKIIFVAVPHIGTPDAVVAMLHGSSVGNGLLMTNQRSRQLMENMPSVYNLLPSSGYFTTVNPDFEVNKVVSFENNPLFDSQLSEYGAFVSNDTELKNYILGTDDRVKPAFNDTKNPNIGNPLLYTEAENTHSILDEWQPASTTKIIQIAGWGEETIAGIDYVVKGGKASYKIRSVVDGDGTVVVPSALWMHTSTPNVERWWVDLVEEGNPLINRAHRDVLEVSNLRDFIESKISGSEFVDEENIIVNNTSTLVSNSRRLHYTLHSPLTLGIRDEYGRYTGLDPITLELIEEIPGVNYKQIGDVKFVSIPTSIDHTLILKGYDSGSFSLDIDEQEGNNVTNITSFQGIPSSASTIVTMNYIADSNIASSTLDIDNNGDGIVDISLNTKLGGVVTPPKYEWGGFLKPINDTKYYPEQKSSVFKVGSTIPVKFQLKDYDGIIVESPNSPKWLPPEKLEPFSASITESNYNLYATIGNEFRWDSVSQQYIYNWSTKGLDKGYWYKISVELNDGYTYSVVIGLR